MKAEITASIITPSYRADFSRAIILSESIDRYADQRIKHYVIVPSRDVSLFSPLQSDRRKIIAAEDVLPKGFLNIPLISEIASAIDGKHHREWWVAPNKLRISGWVIQQLIKIACANIINADVLLFIDSDVEIIRPFNREIFSRAGKIRLYRGKDKIISSTPQYKWLLNCKRLLGIDQLNIMGGDFIGNVISWKRSNVIEMQAHIERVTGLSWDQAMLKVGLFSEYIMYGLFCEAVLGEELSGIYYENKDLTLSSWSFELLNTDRESLFAEELRPDHLGVLLQSTQGFTDSDRRRILEKVLLIAKSQDHYSEDSPSVLS